MLKPMRVLTILLGLLFPVLAVTIAPQSLQAQQLRISAIDVVGTQRIDPETVRSYMLVAPGDVMDPVKLDRSLKALFNTGLFADVSMRRQGSAIEVRVVENPIINRIGFEGNSRVKNSDLEREIQLRPRLVFTRTRVQQDVQRILDIYRVTGRFAATVEPKVIRLDQNRVDLVFEIDEGPLTTIRHVSFVGNKRFDDDDLRSVIQTKEYAWWAFLTTTDTYDPDRLSFDRELLRRHYLKYGYADFRVLSAVAELTQDRQSFVVTFTVEEGDRYKFGKIDLDVAIKRVDEEALAKTIEVTEDDWYNANEVEDTIDSLTDILGSQGYAFVDVRPSTKQDRENRKVDVLFKVGEGEKVFVEKINIVGNVRTLDEVIRREVQLVEGDAFNTSKLRRTRRRIRNLGFFKTATVTKSEGSSPERTNITVEVEEQSTGELSFGAGFSSIDGVIGDIGIRERNLLGKGQDLKVKAVLSAKTTAFDFSFTEPYFLDRDLAAGFDIFSITRKNQEESSFDDKREGISLRTGFDLAPDLNQKWDYTFKRTEIKNVKDDASRFIKDQEGRATVSSIGHEISYDQLDNRRDPGDGYIMGMSNDLAGLGGSENFFRTKVFGAKYFPILDTEWVLGLKGEAGMIFGINDDVAINERFFVGGNNFRGFERSGIGPRDSTTDDALGGNNYYVGTVELGFPLAFLSDIGMKGFVFSDVGSLWDIDESGPELLDSDAPRMSVGTGLAWSTAFGLVRLDFGWAVLKEDFDKTELIRFSFGTRF